VSEQHYKSGAFRRAAENLYRYTATKKYYAVFKCNGKTKWLSLKTTDRELAGRRIKEEIRKHRKWVRNGAVVVREAVELPKQAGQILR